jgi:hypothetical protein
LKKNGSNEKNLMSGSDCSGRIHSRRRENMMIEFISSPVGIAAIVSFFIGTFGTVIVRMWALPLWRYRMLKSRVKTLLEAVESLPGDGSTALPGKEIRKTAVRISDCTSKTLPQWYQLLLAKRNESPDKAVADLMALANIKDRRHAAKRIAGVRAALKIAPK